MRDSDNINPNQHLQNEYLNQDNENIIIVGKKRIKNRKKHYVLEYVQPTVASRLSKLSKSKNLGSIVSHSSMPELNKCTKSSQPRPKSRHGMDKQKKNKGSPFQSKYIVHRVSEHQFDKKLALSGYPKPTNYKIYRCQLGSAEEGCCCSCNSDAMFEVMKGLYDCYKKKNCDKCNCILCGHLQREDKLGEKKKGEEGYITSLKGKTPEEREKNLRDLAMRGTPLPEGKTASEKSLIDKVRGDLGLPIEPKTKAVRDKHKKAAKRGLLVPLKGKTPAEKEKILKGLHNMGIPLPVGRTPSEKALIDKISASPRAPSKATLSTVSPSEQMRRAKAEGLLTPLKGKTPEQRENILKALAMRGIPLPEGQTPSEKKLINKVRGDLGLPIEPKTKAIRDKHEKAAAAGKLLPLEGKTPAEKEKILKGLQDLGIPLPEGRTPSEKSLIARITGSPYAPSKVGSSVLSPSERMRRAKAEGLLTPLEDKTPEQKEKILKGLAMLGIPLPEGQTPSEKKLIDKVRADLGLPKEPKTKSIRDKHQKAADAGLLLPLEGKTPKQKEKILRGQHKMGIPLPEGRTPSEKSLIAKIKAGSPPSLAPSEQLRSAKAEGLLTPLKGKTPEQKEKILRGLAAKGLPLPEAKTPSEKKLVDKVRAELGLPPEPKSKSIRDKHEKAAKQGKLKPLEGKTPEQKEKILKGLHNLGIPLPEGRTPSEKSLIAKIRASPRAPSKAASTILTPSERIRRAKAEGLMTPLEGKTPEQKEKILKGLAAAGLPLPEAKTPSEKKLVGKVRADLGLPPEPKSKSIRDKHDKAAAAGFLKPLEGKTPAQKEKILKGLHDMGIPLPIGRTPSEKSLIARISASPRAPSKPASTVLAPSERIRRAKAEGLLTPLKGKTPDQKEKILKGLAMAGLPLPEAKTPSEKKLIDKVRANLGLPPEPKSKSIRDKHEKAAAAGLLKPLEGKTPAEKEKILKGLHDKGIPLPVGRTPSEKSLIARISASPRAPSRGISEILTPSERMRRAKEAGLLTPLKGKTPEEREKILKGLAMRGMPLPEGQTPSEKKLINKVRADLGLPIEPKTKSIRDKHDKAAAVGKLLPLEGKTPAEKEKILKSLHNMDIPLPVGRTPSEKSLIARITGSPHVPSTVLAPSERMRRAKVEGLLTSLQGKTPEQKEKILRGLAAKGLPLPEAKTPSEKKLVDKVRADLGLPPEPKSKSIRDKHEKAAKQGKLQPLEGKTPAEKEKILKGLHNLGIPLPEGRTPSEKSLIARISASPRAPSRGISETLTPSERMRRAKAAGLLTPLKGKTPEEREKILKGLAMRGMPLPEGQTPSEKKLINKVRADLGLPIEPKTKSIRDKHDKAAAVGKLLPLEGKTPAEKEKILKSLHNMDIPLPVGRTPSEKSLIARITGSPHVPSTVLAPSERLRRAKAEGLLTSLQGKTPEQKEKILRGLAAKGLPLPEAKTPSEKKLVDKVRADLGLPPEPKSKSIRDKHEKAAKQGKLQPLEGKTPAEKEKILKGLHNLGIPLPEGRTPSEKSLIAKIRASPRAPSKAASTILAPSERMRRAKAEGLLTPLQGKTPEQREKILKGLAMRGMPLPEGQTPSEKKLINKVRADLGLPKEPKTKSIRDKHEKAAAAGKLLPLEGRTPAEKEKILKGLHDMDIPLPEGRTPSEKSLIAKIQAEPRAISKAASTILAPSERMRRAKAEGLLTPLTGKTPEQKEKILKGLAMRGIPLPEGQTPSEKKLIDKVRADLGLPKEPKTKSIRDKHEKAAAAGFLQPLEGKTPKQKEKILRGQHKMGIPLPVGRTPSEKSLIAKIRASSRPPSRAVSEMLTPSEQLRRAKAEGLLTPLKGKTPEQREKILRGLAMRGIPLPEGQTPSEKKLINKVRNDLGLPVEPKTKAIRDKHDEAAVAGILLPLEGKTPKQKENILRGQHKMGIPLPVGRTPSEKSLIAKVMASSRPPSQAISSILAHSDHMRRAKAEGLLTPLAGKTPEQREKILRGLAMRGIPLPEGQTPSEKKLINKVRNDLGLPIEPKTKAIRDKHDEAAVAGILLPLEGKTPKQKENILRGQHKMGIPLPVGRTPSEKSLIAKIIAGSRPPSIAHSEKMRRAKAEGLFTPLQGKSPEQKEKILKGLAMAGLPLPEAQTPSEKKLIDKVRADLGLPPEPKSKSIRDKHEKAAKQGKLQPLEGKTPAEKEKTLKGLHDLGIPLPEGRTPSEKSLIAKIRASPRSPSKAASTILAPSERMRRAKAEGLLTPLTGKTPEQREKILKGLAMRGMLLPEGQTPSEKKLIDKVRADLGLPVEPKTKSIRDKHEKAAAAGKLLPLEGKTPAEKEKILKNLHSMGIPLPVGRTASEKSLIAKIKAAPAGKISAMSATKKGIGIGPAGVTQDLEEIVKTEKCDRGCGCDKKKIKFRHSYVKIKVTSPDISSLCDCDYECIPGVKNGAFIDSDGIKVTVGSAMGIPLYTRNFNNHTMKVKISKGHSFTHSEHKGFKYSVHSSYRVSSFESGPFTNNVSQILNSSSSVDSYSTRPGSSDSNIYLQSSTPPYEGRTRKSDKILKDLRRLRSLSDTYKDFKSRSSVSSLDSIFVLKSEISLYTSTSNSDSLSLISVVDSSATPSSTQFSGFQSIDDLLSCSSLDEPTTSDDAIDHHKPIGKHNILRTVIPQREYTILRMSQTKLNFRNKKMRNKALPNSDTDDPVVLFNHLPSKIGVSRIIDKIMAKKRFSAASSIFIVVPTSDEEAEDSSICVDSIKSSRTPTDILSDTSQVDSTLELSPSSLARLDEQVCGRGKKFYMKEVMSSDAESMYQNKPLNVLQHIEMDNDEYCEVNIPKEKTQVVMVERTKEGIRTDLMADISSDCVVKEYSTSIVTSSFSSENQYTDLDVMSKQTTPFYPKGGSGNTFYWQLQRDCAIENSGKISMWVSSDKHTTSTKPLYETGAIINRGKTPSFGRVVITGPTSAASRPVPRGAPSLSSFGDVGCTLFRHKRSGIYCTGMQSPSSESFGGTKMLLSNTPTPTSYSDRRIFRHKSPGFYRLTDTRSPSAKSIVMLCDNYASPGIDLRTSPFRNKPLRRSPDMRTPSPKSIMQSGSKPPSKSSLSKKRRKRSSSSSSDRIRFSDKPEVINDDRPARRRSPVKTPLCPDTCSSMRPNQCKPLECGCGAPVDRTPCAETSAPSRTATCPTCDQTDDYCRDQRPRGQEFGKPLSCGCRVPVDSSPCAESSASTRTDTCPSCGETYDYCRGKQPGEPGDPPWCRCTLPVGPMPSPESSPSYQERGQKRNDVKWSDNENMSGKALSCGCRVPEQCPTCTEPSELSCTPTGPDYEPSNDCFCDSSRGEYNKRINDWQASGELPRGTFRQSPGGPPPSRASDVTRSTRKPCCSSDEGESLSCGCQKLDECAPDPYYSTGSTKCPNSNETSDCCCESGGPPPSPATSEFTRSSRNPCCEPSDADNPLECGCQELDDCASSAKCPNSNELSDCCCESGGPPPSPATSQFTRSSKNPCCEPLDEDEPFECGCQELDDCAPDPCEVTSTAKCPNSSEVSDCCCLDNGVDCSETSSCRCSQRTEPSDLSCLPTCPDYEPSDDCYCDSSRLESGDGNRSAKPCECRFPTVSSETSECTHTDPCLSHVPLDNDYHHGRLGHNMHSETDPYQYDACHQNDECPCVPDISDLTHKPTPFCMSHAPLRGCFHPGRHGHDLHFDPVLGCHPSVTSNIEICPCKGDYPSMRSCEPDPRMCAGEQEYVELCSPKKQCSETYIMTTPTSISQILSQQHGDTLPHSELTKKILDSTNRLSIYDSNDITYPIAQTNSKYMEQNQACLPFERSRSEESYFCRNIFKKKKTAEGENKSKKPEVPANKVTAETQDIPKELENPCGKELAFGQNKSENQEVPCGLEFCHGQNKPKILEIPTKEDSCDCHNQSNMVDGTCGKKSCFGRNIFEKLKATVNKEFFQDISKKLEIFCDEEFSFDDNKSKELEGPNNTEPCSDQNKFEKLEAPDNIESCFDQNKSKNLKGPDNKDPCSDQNRSEKLEAPNITEPCFDPNKSKKLKSADNKEPCSDQNKSEKLEAPDIAKPCFDQNKSNNLKAPVNKVSCLDKNKSKKSEASADKKYSSDKSKKLEASTNEEPSLYKNRPKELEAPIMAHEEPCFDQEKSKKLPAPTNKKSCLDKNKSKKPEFLVNTDPGFDQNKSKKIKVRAYKKSCNCQNISKNVENPCGKGVCKDQIKSKMLNNETCFCRGLSKKPTVPAIEKSCWNQDTSENEEAPTNKKKTCLCKKIPKKLEVLYGKDFCQSHKCKKREIPANKKSRLDQNIYKIPNISANTEPFYQEVSKRLKEYINNQNSVMPQRNRLENQAVIAMMASNSRQPPQIEKKTSFSRLHNIANCDKIDYTSKYRESTLSQIDASTDPENQECDDTSQTENVNDECCRDNTMSQKFPENCPYVQDKSTFIDDDVKQNEIDAVCQYETTKRRRRKKIFSNFTKLFQKKKKEVEASSRLKPSRSVQTLPDLGLCSECQPKAQLVCDNENMQQPQQTLPYVVNPKSPSLPPCDDYPYQHPCGWIHQGKLMKLKSDLSECTSGFKACKKKKWPSREIVLSFEDAVKYYAGMNLEQFRDLLPPLELNPEEYKSKKGKKLLQKKLAKEKCERKKIKKQKKKNNCKKGKRNIAIEEQTFIANLSDEDEKNIVLKYGPCECCYGPRPQEVVIPKEKTPEELEKLFPKGMKLSVVAKTHPLQNCSSPQL